MAERHARIVRDPEILGGKPILEGTRMSVEFILELFEADLSVDDILEGYPHLTRADLRAIIAYARRAIKRTPERRDPRRVAA